MIPDSRIEVIRTLLERYPELVDPMTGAEGLQGSGERVPLMPRTYTRSVQELERLLRQMRDDGGRITTIGTLLTDVHHSQRLTRVSLRALWWHLNQRYIAGTTRTRDVAVVRKTKNGKRLRTTERRTVPQVNPLVRPDSDGTETIMVRAGIVQVAALWPDTLGEPMVPAELLVAA